MNSAAENWVNLPWRCLKNKDNGVIAVKRLCCILCLLVLMAGCGMNEAPLSTESVTEPETTEPAGRDPFAMDIAFDGEVFVDNATRNADGTYTRTQNVSEACQYYGVLFGGVDLADAKYAQLAQHIKNGFANFNKGDRDFCPINAFIGLYLRMNVLSNLGWNDVIAADVEGFFGDMCDETGTLWECRKDNGLPVGSLDHGFASYVATVLPTGN